MTAPSDSQQLRLQSPEKAPISRLPAPTLTMADSIPTPSDVDAKVRKSLEGTPFEASKLTQLSGGNVNWTYAATLLKPLDDGTETVMVKHAEDRMKSRPDTILSLTRAVSPPRATGISQR